MAVRCLSAMKYRLAGATYCVIAEKLTEERAQVYAEANGISIDRAMKKIQPVASKTAWEDVTAEMEDLRRETEVQRADLMALENARLDQLFAKALSLYGKGSVPAGRRAIATTGTAGPFRGRIVAGTRPAASRCRGTRRPLLYAGSLSVVRLSQGRGGSGQSAGSAARHPRPTDTFGRPRVRRSRRPRSARPCGRFSSCRPA